MPQRRGTAPRQSSTPLQLIITNTDAHTHGVQHTDTGKDDFRKLANDIMEEYMVDDEGSDDDGDDDTDHEPTFTYPASSDGNGNGNSNGIETCDDGHPWQNVAYLLASGNTTVTNALCNIGVAPSQDGLTDFYYSAYDDGSPQHKHWQTFDALEKIMTDDVLGGLFLREELTK